MGHPVYFEQLGESSYDGSSVDVKVEKVDGSQEAENQDMVTSGNFRTW